MPTLRYALWMLSAAPMVFTAGAACGQDFPVKPIRIITSAPGGGSDFASRLIASGLTDSLGQQVIVDNRGNFGGEILAKARPGELNYGSGGIGGASHLPAELFKSMAGVNIVNVNYKGVGPAMNALMSRSGFSAPAWKSWAARRKNSPPPSAPTLPSGARSSRMPASASSSRLGVTCASHGPACVR